MDNVKYLLRNLNVLNIILICILASFVIYAVVPMRHKKVSYKPAEAKVLPSSAAAAKEKHDEVKPPSPNDYIVVAEQNLFHPERKIPVPKVEAAPLPKPDFVLYGTLVTEDVHIAYMEDKKAPHSTQGRGKRQTSVRQGDSISGFVLKQIDNDKVVMSRGDETLVVRLDDNKKVREVATTPAAAHPQPTSPVAAAPQAGKPMTPRAVPAAPGQPQVSAPARPAPARPSVGRRPSRRGLFGAGGGAAGGAAGGAGE